MMKKMIAMMLVLVLVFSTAITVRAAEAEFTLPILVFEDGAKVEIATWLEESFGASVVDSILAGITFALYSSDAEGAFDAANEVPGVIGRIDPLTSTISFSDDESGEPCDISAGWYLVRETMNDLAKRVFREPAADMLLYFDGSSAWTGRGDARIASSTTFTVTQHGGQTLHMQAIYQDNAGKLRYLREAPALNVENPPYDDSLELTTSRFTSTADNGTSYSSFCADIAAIDVKDSYVVDENQRGLSDVEMHKLVAAIDYVYAEYGFEAYEGVALAQVVVWNMLLQYADDPMIADLWLRDIASGLLYTDAWGELIQFEGLYMIDEEDTDEEDAGEEGTGEEGTDDEEAINEEDCWYTPEHKALIDDIISDAKTGTKYLDLYRDKVAAGIDTRVSGAVFLKGDGTHANYDQRRQLVILFDEPATVTHVPCEEEGLDLQVFTYLDADGNHAFDANIDKALNGIPFHLAWSYELLNLTEELDAATAKLGGKDGLIHVESIYPEAELKITEDTSATVYRPLGYSLGEDAHLTMSEGTITIPSYVSQPVYWSAAAQAYRVNVAHTIEAPLRVTKLRDSDQGTPMSAIGFTVDVYRNGEHIVKAASCATDANGTAMLPEVRLGDRVALTESGTSYTISGIAYGENDVQALDAGARSVTFIVGLALLPEDSSTWSADALAFELSVFNRSPSHPPIPPAAPGRTTTTTDSATANTVEVGGLDLRVSSQANGERLSVTMTGQQRQELIASPDEAILLDVSGYNADHDIGTSVSTVRLAKSDFRAFAEADKALVIVNDHGGIIIDVEATASLAATAGTISGSSLDITLKQIDSSNLPDNMSAEQKEDAEALLAEGALIFDVDILIGSHSLGAFAGSIDVDVAYELKEGESAEGMSVWYLNDDGELEELPCTYENGRIRFALPGHFSFYVIGYSQAKADAALAAAAAVKPEPEEPKKEDEKKDPVVEEPKPIVLTIDSSIVRQGEETLSAPPVAPQIINGRTMLPFRYLIQTLFGGEVDWDAGTRTVTAEINGVMFRMTIDDTTITIDGKTINFDQAPVIVNDYTLVPLRAFEAAVGSITWDEATRTVAIYP